MPKTPTCFLVRRSSAIAAMIAIAATALAFCGCSNSWTDNDVENPAIEGRAIEGRATQGAATQGQATTESESLTIINGESSSASLTSSASRDSRLESPASNVAWSQSAMETARQTQRLIENQRIDDAVQLTRRALKLPRHPDRNDPYGWGHATMCSSLLIAGLVDAEQWDEIIQICNDSDLKIGNELVESQRIRALSLAHWSKHQFVFRSQILNEQLNELRRSLVNRFDIQHHWNQTCTPDELIEIDHEFLDGTKQHIRASQEFIAILEQSKPKSKKKPSRKPTQESKQNLKTIGELKALFRDSGIRLALDESSIESETHGIEPNHDLEFEKLLKTHRAAPAIKLLGRKNDPTSTFGDTGGVEFSAPASQARLIVFYLGGECLHCAAQLKAIGPYQKKFEDAEIEIVGISADNEAKLAESLEIYNGNIRFPIFADGNRNVFWQFGLVTNRQDEPMHGTFLVNRSGTVLWHDIGAEPFTDISFLLTESKRLLAISEPKN